jgi:hypothetical protein
LNESDFTTVHVPHVDGKYYFTHKKYGYIYWHDIGSIDNKFSPSDVENFISKYNRRYERLINTIKTSEPICFLSVNHFGNIYNNKKYKKEDILKLYDFLYEINNNITFFAINYTEEDSLNNTLHFVNLYVDNEIPHMESKLQFAEKLKIFALSNLNF